MTYEEGIKLMDKINSVWIELEVALRIEFSEETTKNMLEKITKLVDLEKDFERMRIY